MSFTENPDFDFNRFANNRNYTDTSLTTLLKITIERCNGLKDVDFMGKSDPYCILEGFNGHSIPGPNWESASGRAKGRVIDDNLDPEFNEDYYFLVDDDVTRCKLIVKDDGVVDTKIGSQMLDLSTGVEGGGTINLVPQGTCTFTFRRAPLYKALTMKETSTDNWVDTAKHPTRMQQVICICPLAAKDLADEKQQYYCKISDFRNASGNPMAVDGGTKHSGDARGTFSKTEVYESSDGIAEWDESFVFLAPAKDREGPQSCMVSVYDKDMIGSDDVIGQARLSFDDRNNFIDITMEPKGVLKLQYATVDIDVGITYDAGEERAAIEAALAAKAEAARQEAEAEAARVEAALKAEAERRAAEFAAAEAKRKAEEEAKRLEEERIAAEEAAAAEQKRLEELAAAEAAAEEAERLRAEAEAKRKAAEEENARRLAEAEEKRKAAEAETARLQKEAEEKAEAERKAKEAEFNAQREAEKAREAAAAAARAASQKAAEAAAAAKAAMASVRIPKFGW